ncbi:MAG: peptide chain release factor N(5)-glutamine methyltransferase [Deltaproteobacteria bacterium]|nr:peptide chain release factor N(5)-glutamine methyltransferase [Deltaproteobacteria bacterium]TLN02835.1 MAG: peptide chain release factor N(5)-glutamine methyltransferase [bacterium]
MTDTWTILKVLTWTRGYLAEKGVENSRLEAEWLLCEALGLDRVGLYVNFDKPLSDSELSTCRALVARRARREPLQYILGSQDFYGLDFEVSPGVLIPRHDTETLVEEAVKRCPAGATILDIGVGSGCIAVALAKARTDARIHGVDLSAKALELARRNVDRHGVTVNLAQGSLFEPFAGRKFDLIVSNPPYIPTADLAGLQPEVRDYEPREALDGGADGLDYYRRIIPAAADFLVQDGWLLLEIGIGEAPDVSAIFTSTGMFHELFSACDAGGVERVAGGRKK